MILLYDVMWPNLRVEKFLSLQRYSRNPVMPNDVNSMAVCQAGGLRVGVRAGFVEVPCRAVPY